MSIFTLLAETRTIVKPKHTSYCLLYIYLSSFVIQPLVGSPVFNSRSSLILYSPNLLDATRFMDPRVSDLQSLILAVITFPPAPLKHFSSFHPPQATYTSVNRKTLTVCSCEMVDLCLCSRPVMNIPQRQYIYLRAVKENFTL